MERWWEHESDARVLGVFQGGGAKGVAYAGALRAVAARGLWFAQVAGSSAGAITAVMVAAGVRPEELDDITAEALQSVRWQAVGLIAGRDDSLLKSAPLGDWLDGQLRRRVGGDAQTRETGVTFKELETASGIGCHVVALDLGTGYPIVFSGALTPDAAVVEAVLSSSAIPGALSAGRAVVTGPEGARPLRVHHLIDGGAWANYPTFVFRERGFRAWAERHMETSPGEGETEAHENLSADTTSMPLLGFVLDSPRSEPTEVVEVRPRNWRLYQEADLGVGRSSGSLPTYAVSQLLGTAGWRIGLALAALLLCVTGVSFLPEIVTDVNEGGWRLFDWWGGPVIAGLGALLVLLVVTLVVLAGLLALTLGRAIAYSGLPSARALLGVATRVPPWAYHQPDALVLNLRSLGVSTLRFRLNRRKRAEVVDTAELEARRQLDARADLLERWGVSHERLEQAARAPAPENATAEPEGIPGPARGLGDPRYLPAVVAACAFLLGAGVAFVLRGIWEGRPWLGVLFALVIGAWGVAVYLLLSRRAHDRAAGLPPFRTGPLVALGVALVVVLGAMLLTASSSSDRTLIEATVQSASAVDGSDDVRYRWEEEDGERSGVLLDSLSFRVDEPILVEPDGPGWQLATPGSTSFASLFFPVGFILAAIAIFFFITDEVLYRRYRQTVEAAAG